MKTNTSNLPQWAGASVCYSRAYAMLAHMSKTHVSIVRGQCRVSEDMRRIIDALNKGDEEQIKGLLLEREQFAVSDRIYG
jgi:hypothetical protein